MRALNRDTPLLELIEICERSGNLFEASNVYNIPSNGNAETIFKTGEKPVVVFSRKVSYNGGGVLGYAYRDSLYTDGTSIGTYCNNDFFIDSASASSIILDATITNQGIQTRAMIPMFGNESNQGQGETLGEMDRPWLIPPNKTNLLVLTNRDNTAQEVGALIHWIEFDNNIPGIEFVDGAWTYRGITI